MAILYTYVIHISRCTQAVNEASIHALSHQLFFDAHMMVEGFVGLLDDLAFRWGNVAVCARKLNQDSLESLFGHLRFLCGGGSDPNIFKAVHALPTIEAQRDISLKTARWRSMNSSQPARRAVAASGDTTWLSGHHICKPATYAALCAQARVAKCAPHPVYWQTLREIQKVDEIACREKRGGHRVLRMLKENTHINKTGFSRMRVGLARDVVGIALARLLQLLRLGELAI